MTAPRVAPWVIAEGAAAPGASGATGPRLSEGVAVGPEDETRLTGPLGLVPLMEVRGTAEMVEEPRWLTLVLTTVSVVPLALATLVITVVDSAVLEAATDELLDVGSSTNEARMRISWHCSPIHSSYRLLKVPLRQFHHRVVPPMARDLFWQTEKPPV